MKRHDRRPVLLVIALLASVAARLSAEEPRQPVPSETDPFSGRQRVTAVDVVVEVQRHVGPYERQGPAGRLEAADFTVLEDGVPRPIVGVETDPTAEPWRLVVYFDLPLVEPAAVAWAAGALADRAAALTALGSVAIVVAADEPRTVLAASRDPVLVAQTLEGIAREPGGRHELLRLRAEVARELAADEPALPPRELAELAAAEEVRFVRERADVLLLHLLSVAAEPGVGPRRALLWVTSGWDADPAAFYRGRLGGREAGNVMAGAADDGSPLGRPAEPLARTLAAYGWTTLVLAPPVPKPPEWHLRRRAQVQLDGLHRPKLGAALRELGEQRALGGELEAAADALSDAIHAFYDHPASAAEQALAEAQLADVLVRLGKVDEGERLLRRALRRDPYLAGRHPGAAVMLADPLAPLVAVAGATAGRLVEEREEEPGSLDSALASLGRRVRITYQVPGLPDGTLRLLEVSVRGATRRQRAPRWARSGTPERIAEARLRRLLSGSPVEGASLRVQAAAGDGGLGIAVGDAAARGEAVFRVTAATPAAEAFVHRVGEPATVADGEVHRRRVPLPDGEAPAAVVVEDLASGRWGWVALEAGDSEVGEAGS